MKLWHNRIPFLVALALGSYSCETVSVTAVDVANIAVSPSDVSLPPGQSQQLRVRITDAEGNVLSGRNVVWTTTDQAVARVDGAGNVTAVNPGNAMIRASTEGVSGTASVTVDRTGELVLSAQTVRLQVQQGIGADPAQIEITNGGSGSLTGLEAGVQYGPGASGWLSVSLSRDFAPAILTIATVQEVVDALAPGIYTATVSVSAPNAGNGSVEIEVTLTVSPPEPAIGVNPPSRTFVITEGGAPPAPQTVTVTNIGGQELTGLTQRILYSSNQTGWLMASLSSASAPSTLTLSLHSSVSSLPVGVYRASVEIRSPVAVNSPASVQVTLTVGEPPPTIVLSAASVDLITVEGAPPPAPRDVTVSNGGGGVLDSLFQTVRWDVGDPGWMVTSFSSQTAPATLRITADSEDLAAGLYRATIAVASPFATNSPQELTVSLVVQTPAVIVLAPDAVKFEASQNGASPAPQSVAVTNGGEAELTGLTATVVGYGGGQDGWLAAALSGGTTAPTTLDLTATLGTRTPDTLTAQVEVASPVAANGADTVDVTFVIELSPPAAPTDLTQTAITTSSISVRFTDNANNEAGFVLEHRTHVGGWTLVNGDSLAASAGTGPVDVLDTGLIPGSLYDYRVHAFNDAGVSSTLSRIPGFWTVPAAPTLTSADTTGTTTVALTWTSNNGHGVTFTVQRSPNGSSGWSTLASGLGFGTTTYTHSGAADGTAHFYRIIATNPSGADTSNVLSTVTRLNTPTGLTATPASSTSINLSWTHGTGSAASITYDVERDGVVVATATSSPTTITGLTPVTEYDFRVRATAPGIPTSGWSNVATATTLDVPPAAPTGVTATAVSTSLIDVDWTDESGNETGFEIERNGAIVGTVGPNVETFPDGGRADGTTYSYRVRAVNGAGPSAWVGPAAATTPLNAPTGLTATAASSTSIDLSWSHSTGSSATITFDIEQDGTIVGTATGTSTTITGLTPATEYDFRVRATATGVPTSGWSNVATEETDDVPPTAPTGVTATAASTSLIDVDWTDESGNETGFEIERDGAIVATVGVNVETFPDGGRTDGTTYSYRVRAINGAGTSAWVGPTSETTPLIAPSGLSATSNAAGSSISLSWTDGSGGEDGYDVYRDGALLTSLGAGATSHPDGSVVAGTEYDYHVCATDPVAADACSATVTETATAVDMEVVTVSVTPAATTAPDTVTFTVTVMNNGPSTATNVSVAMTRTGGLTFVSDSPGQGTYTDGAAPTWDVGTLASGASVTLTVDYSVAAAATETLTVTGITEDQTDTVAGNETGADSVVVS